MKQQMLYIASILVLFGIFLFSGFIDNTPVIEIKPDEHIIFTDTKPDKNDPNIVACIPAAFTNNDGKIVGHYCIHTSRQGISDKRFTTVHLDEGTYFQQLTLVKRGKALDIKDSKLRYRRALCKQNGKYYVVHSKIPKTLSGFSKDLAKNYDSAWNLDMGSYSYGWYKTDGKVHTLGISSVLNKEKQSNWIIIKKI